jgi:NADH dehydrogenase
MKRIIFLSHLTASFKPNMPIVFSKWLAEEELKHAQIPYTVLRCAVIFGSQDRFVEVMASIMQHLSFFPVIGDGKSVVQPLWVEDVVSAIIDSLERPDMEYKILSLAGPDQFFFDDLVDIIMNSMGITRRKIHLPSALIMPVGDLLSRLVPKFPVSFQELALLQMDTRTELDTVEKHFGFKPRDFRKEIASIIAGRREMTISAILNEKKQREEERKAAFNEDIDF